ncbi:replication protein [Actinobacillus pleuropneumoniae]|uniref:hypothetical protein n=1 Tax=Actinobacillus pleuropneumoniae TaxID=715 RepID=UPI001A988FD9|nr:hypothetical protein [Actinobacillus pleuropneumoniae]QSZ38500.1 replication protein [Actinobacillus pleuropneumoniae]
MSKLLINEQPLQVLPSLAVAIGLNEAIFVQQLHYFSQISRNQSEGKKWVFNTVKNWQKIFKFWSVKTMQRTIENVEKMGLVLSTDKFNRMKMDKTKWYAINYEKLAEITANFEAENTNDDQMTFSQNDHFDLPEMENAFSQNDQMTFSQNDQSNNHKILRDHNNNPLPLSGESADAEGNAGGNAETLPPEKKKSIPVDYEGVMEEFNLAVQDTPIKQIRVMSDNRKRLVHSLAKLMKKEFGGYGREYFADYFRDFISQANQRRDRFYFGGPNGDKWIADFEYIVKPKAFAKTLEDAL